MKNSFKWLLLVSLYFSQGLPFGFFVQALPVMFRRQGASLTEVGLLFFLALPWGLKALWAPLVDRWYSPKWGRRRSWIIPLQLLTALVLAFMAYHGGSSDVQVLLSCVAFLNLLAATQDIATDGFAVELLQVHERGLANGIQVAGYRVGMIVGGGVLMVLHKQIGAMWTFTTMSLLIVLASVPVLLMKEKGPDVAPNEMIPKVPHFVSRPGALAILAVWFLFKAGEAMGSSMLKTFLVDIHWSDRDIGLLLGVVGFVAGLVGALVGGLLVNRLGRKRSLIVFGSLQAVSVGSLVVLSIAKPSVGLIYLLSTLEHFIGGMATAALFTCMMDFCLNESSGADYTSQASVVVISTGLFSVLAGISADVLGYRDHFLLSTILAFVSVAAVWKWFPARADEAKGGAVSEGSPHIA